MSKLSPQPAGVMQIGEVAKLTALSVDAIRFYERRTLLSKVPRTVGHFRIYTDADVIRLSFIRQMQGLGFSLREVQQLLDLREERREACAEVRNLLTAKLKQVRSKIRELEQLERGLELDLEKCHRELRRRKGHVPRSCPVLANPNGKATGSC